MGQADEDYCVPMSFVVQRNIRIWTVNVCTDLVTEWRMTGVVSSSKHVVDVPHLRHTRYGAFTPPRLNWNELAVLWNLFILVQSRWCEQTFRLLFHNVLTAGYGDSRRNCRWSQELRLQLHQQLPRVLTVYSESQRKKRNIRTALKAPPHLLYSHHYHLLHFLLLRSATSLRFSSSTYTPEENHRGRVKRVLRAGHLSRQPVNTVKALKANLYQDALKINGIISWSTNICSFLSALHSRLFGDWVSMIRPPSNVFYSTH